MVVGRFSFDPFFPFLSPYFQDNYFWVSICLIHFWLQNCIFINTATALLHEIRTKSVG